jgi:hypothetical protein
MPPLEFVAGNIPAVIQKKQFKQLLNRWRGAQGSRQFKAFLFLHRVSS